MNRTVGMKAGSVLVALLTLAVLSSSASPGYSLGAFGSVREGDLRVADRDAVRRDRGAGGAVRLVGRLRYLAGRAAGEYHRARDGDGDKKHSGVGRCTGRGAASRADHGGRPSCLGTPGGTAVRAPVRWVASAAPGRSRG